MGKVPIDYAKMPEMIGSIPDLALRALVATHYACATRISEIIALQKSKITDRGEYWELELANRKNKADPTKYGIILKNREQWILEPFEAWFKICGEQVFPWKDARARELIRKATGYSSHYFRHSRLTHLVKEFNFDAFDIKATAGHARMDTSTIYVHKKTIDRAKKMLMK